MSIVFLIKKIKERVLSLSLLLNNNYY